MLTGPTAVGLTLLFGATALYCAFDWSRARTTSSRAAAGLVDANHVVMSVAMVAMLWWPTGRWGNTLQAIVFVVFAIAIALSTTAAHRVEPALHALMNLAMAWMLGAMHLIMPGHGSSGGGGHAGHHGGGSQNPATTPAADPAPWVEAVTQGAVLACAAMSLFWLWRAVRGPRRWHSICHVGMAAGMATMLQLM